MNFISRLISTNVNSNHTPPPVHPQHPQKNITASISDPRLGRINHTWTSQSNRRNHHQSLTTSTLTHQWSTCWSNVGSVSGIENVLASDQRTVLVGLSWRIQKTCLALPHYDAKFKKSHQGCLLRYKTTPLVNIKTSTKSLKLHQKSTQLLNFHLPSRTTVSKLSP